MAPSTPPPPSIRSFAALTIASTSSVVMSARTTSTPMWTVVDRHWWKRLLECEVENHAVEVQLRLEAADDRVRLAEAVLLAWERQIGHRQSFGPHRVGHHL